MLPMYVRDLASLGEKEFFICFSMTVMGLVTVIEWEMLFPDRRDYANLTPLPIRLRTMFGAKIAALLAFLAVFPWPSTRFRRDVSGGGHCRRDRCFRAGICPLSHRQHSGREYLRVLPLRGGAGDADERAGIPPVPARLALRASLGWWRC
jgi:hypothetical protein